MKYIYLFFIVGIILLSYSLSLAPYIDLQLFHSKYMELTVGQSQEYFNLREEMLTPKFFLQDIGIFILISSTLILIFLKFWKGKVKTPKSKIWFVILAVILPLLTTGGFIFDLMQAMTRDEFPHWSDSLGVPLMGTPIMLISLLFWSFIHLIFLHERSISATEITLNTFKKINKWLLAIIVISFLITLQATILGQYWYGIPGFIWIYYYLSLGVIRQENKQSTPQTYKSTQETIQ